MSDGYCKCGMWERDCRCDEDSGQVCKHCGCEATWGEVADGLCPDDACRAERRKARKKRRAS